MEKNSRLINIIFVSGFFVVLLGAFARYYYLKEYIFHIETPCDPAFEICFVRDCEADECPPNGLSHYRTFDILANKFDACEADNCEFFCETNPSECVELVCDSEVDSCSEILQ